MSPTAQPLVLHPPARQRRLPSLGLPVARDGRRGWAVLSTVVHVLVLAFLLTRVATHEGFVVEIEQGAGGKGEAGGGGGHRGTGGDVEHLQYVSVAPPPADAVVVPPPPQVVPPPVVTPLPVPETKPPLPDISQLATQVASLTPGVRGGSGSDGSIGHGPGSGGGVGAGIGPGRGSGQGPGVGGGTQANYPPTPTELFIPPLPMPDKVRGFHLVAEYDIDETGKVVDFHFTPTKDRDYNKRLDEVLRSFRFRPGTKPDGTPIRMRAQIVYDF